MENQITLLQSSISNFKNNSNILAHNQLILSSRINDLQEIIKNLKIEQVETYHYFSLEQIASQFSTSFQMIYDTLEKIGIAISFAKLNTFHNSIADPNELLSEISEINQNIGERNKFPMQISLQNVLQLEQIIEIKSYSKHNNIIFILEIPIVENLEYNYYHLYSLPTPSTKSFKTIIPQSKFLLLNEQNYAFTNTKCKEILKEEFICTDLQTQSTSSNIPCEVQLLKYHEADNTCLQIPVKMDNVKIQKIEDNQWIIITPASVVATQKCGKNIISIPLNGSYFLELINQCEVSINNITLKNFKTKIPKFKSIELPNLQFPNSVPAMNSFHLNKVQIDSVNLDEISNIQSVLQQEKTKLENLDLTPVHFKKISFYTILLYVLVFVCTAFAIWKICQRRKRSQNNTRVPVEKNFKNLPVISNSGETP